MHMISASSYISSIQTHKSHFVFVNHALEWLSSGLTAILVDWRYTKRLHCIQTLTKELTWASQQGWIEVAVIICASVAKNAIFWLCITQPSFPSLPIPSHMEAKLQLSSGLLCACLLISAFLFSALQSLFLLTWSSSPCVLLLCHFLCIYLCIYVCICLSI